MEPAYERKPNESAKAFAALQIYADQGPERSLAAVGKALGKSEGLIERWSRRYDWGNRVRAHDARQAALEREAAEAQLRAKTAEGARRRQEAQEEEWTIRGDCMRAAREALKRFHENARRGATLGDIARIIEVGSKMGRLATGMATDHTEVTGQDGGPIQIELMPALRKVYGEIVDLSDALGPRPEGSENQVLLLPRGDCTDATCQKPEVRGQRAVMTATPTPPHHD